MDLSYDIPERTNKNDLGLNLELSLSNVNISNSDRAGMNDILNNIKAAATDPNISGIFIETSTMMTSTANIQEIREQLIEFRKSGKFVISYSDSYSQSAYYLATAGDKIYLTPSGMLDIHGMASQIMFYKHLFDKLDIEPQIIRGPNNKFKSAVEPYFLDKMSEANREQYDELLGSVWGQITEDISVARNIDITKINEFADNLTLVFDDETAYNNNFVDGLLYRDQIIDELHKLTGSAADDDINLIFNQQYASSRPKTKASSDKIAIVYAYGSIIDGEGDESTIGSITLSKAIREAREDKNVKAIVMRVNSPGGSALASEVIRREVELAANAKPFIVSMGNYAASGGYWISADSDYIFADATTLTGSIGVFAMIPNLEGLFNDKIGITFDVVKTNENSDFGTVTQPLTPYQKEMLQQSVGKTYDKFTTLVADSRKLRKSFVDSIGQGRVWSGIDAKELGLVDEIGGIEEAIAYAADKANITDSYSIKEYPKTKSLYEELLLNSPYQEKYTKEIMKTTLGETYPYLESIGKFSRLSGIYALMPFNFHIE